VFKMYSERWRILEIAGQGPGLGGPGVVYGNATSLLWVNVRIKFVICDKLSSAGRCRRHFFHQGDDVGQVCRTCSIAEITAKSEFGDELSSIQYFLA